MSTKLVNGERVQMQPAEVASWEASKVTTPHIPISVTALQALLAIDGAGLSEAYEAWASDPERTFAQRAFITKALIWNRSDEVLNEGATALGLTSEQLDQLFVAASSL